MNYLVKIPAIVQRWIYPGFTWRMPAGGKKIYLTFDDGPHPSITPFVLDELKIYGAKATFFCVGSNVEKHPEVYKRIISEGHAVGNHTYNHLNGWKTADKTYLEDIAKAAGLIDSGLFRPPHGRITRFQAARLKEQLRYRIIMWRVLSGDFDPKISPEKCLRNVMTHTGDGDIVVFHDSEKAYERMKFALPLVLKGFAEKGYVFEKITG